MGLVYRPVQTLSRAKVGHRSQCDKWDVPPLITTCHMFGGRSCRVSETNSNLRGWLWLQSCAAGGARAATGQLYITSDLLENDDALSINPDSPLEKRWF